jgi:hypothetical protein
MMSRLSVASMDPARLAPAKRCVYGRDAQRGLPREFFFLGGLALFNRRCSLTGMIDIRHQSTCSSKGGRGEVVDEEVVAGATGYFFMVPGTPLF